MPFTIPDLPASPTAEQIRQSTPDAVDFDVLVGGSGESGVASGCAVTQRGAGANMSVDVAAGVVTVLGIDVAVVAVNKVISNGDPTNPRFDLITVNNAGTVAVTAGTAASNPLFPVIPANSVCLAAVYIAANTTVSIVTADLVDKRVPVTSYLNGMVNTLPLSDVNVSPTQEELFPSGLTIQSGVNFNIASGGKVDLGGTLDPWLLPWGVKGYYLIDGTSGAISTTETTIFDITFMQQANRVYRITLSMLLAGTVAGDQWGITLKRDDFVNASFSAWTAAAASKADLYTQVYILGVSTTKIQRLGVTLIRNSGTGTVAVQGSGVGNPANYFVIEDIGPILTTGSSLAIGGTGDHAVFRSA